MLQRDARRRRRSSAYTEFLAASRPRNPVAEAKEEDVLASGPASATAPRAPPSPRRAVRSGASSKASSPAPPRPPYPPRCRRVHTRPPHRLHCLRPVAVLDAATASSACSSASVGLRRGAGSLKLALASPAPRRPLSRIQPSAKNGSNHSRRPQPGHEWNSAPTICLPRQPLCLECPVMNLCLTRGEHATAARDKPQSRVTAIATLSASSTAHRGPAPPPPARRRPDAQDRSELPPLPLEAVGGRRTRPPSCRHAITNTNYYVQIFARVRPRRLARSNSTSWRRRDRRSLSNPAPRIPVLIPDRARRTPCPRRTSSSPPTRPSTAPASTTTTSSPPTTSKTTPTSPASKPTPASPLPRASSSRRSMTSQSDLEWTPTNRLTFLPLTGLTRKVLQRLGVMTLPRVQLS